MAGKVNNGCLSPTSWLRSPAADCLGLGSTPGSYAGIEYENTFSFTIYHLHKSMSVGAVVDHCALVFLYQLKIVNFSTRFMND